jgi:hypothetical protein
MYQRSTFGRCLLGLAVFALCTSAPRAFASGPFKPRRLSPGSCDVRPRNAQTDRSKTRKPTVQAPAFIAGVM